MVWEIKWCNLRVDVIGNALLDFSWICSTEFSKFRNGKVTTYLGAVTYPVLVTWSAFSSVQLRVGICHYSPRLSRGSNRNSIYFTLTEDITNTRHVLFLIITPQLDFVTMPWSKRKSLGKTLWGACDWCKKSKQISLLGWTKFALSSQFHRCNAPGKLT